MTNPELTKAVEELREVRGRLLNQSFPPADPQKQAYDLACRVDAVIAGLCAERRAAVDHGDALMTEARLAGRLGAFETVAALLRKLLPPALLVDVLACLDPLPDFLQCLRQREMTQQAQPAPDSCQNGVEAVPDEGHGDKAWTVDQRDRRTKTYDPLARDMKKAFDDLERDAARYFATAVPTPTPRAVFATILEQEMLTVMESPNALLRVRVEAIVDACRGVPRSPDRDRTFYDNVATGTLYDQARRRAEDLLKPLN